MRHALAEDLDCSRVQAFLASRFDPASREVEQIGAGAWSRCFGFHRGEQELVVRFGQHIGLDHLAYNAYLGDWVTLVATADRMRALAGRGGRP